MATTGVVRPSSNDTLKARPISSRRKKEQQRTEIWSNLLRQTREAQARSRTQNVQNRDLILCGGSPDDQRSFLEQHLARPPPPQPPSRNQQRDVRASRRGEVRLSNQFAYGYGHVTLFSPPTQSGTGGALLGGEAEEVAKVEVHTIPEPDIGYERTLRQLLKPKKELDGPDKFQDDDMGVGDEETEGRRLAMCILMSWTEPWLFLDRLRRWLALLARSVLPLEAWKDENPLEVLKEHRVHITVVLQHVEAQEPLLRENYTEEDFDFISQTIRTCLLPIAGALTYTPSSPPPQPPGAPLSEVQKVLYSGLDIDIGLLQARGAGGAKKSDDQVLPKHNVVDRMAIVVPSGWDSLGKIRLLSETFSPEAVMEGWVTDLSIPVFRDISDGEEPNGSETKATNGLVGMSGQPDDGAEVFETTSPLANSPLPSPPLSPSKMPKSAIASYENQIQDPNAHKARKPPQIEVTTKPEQEFLAEMRAQLQQYEAQDSDRQRLNPSSVSTTQGALSGALRDLGDVSFNVGGVSYNTVSAEAAIERLKRPQPESSSPTVGTPRTVTPRPPRRDGESRSTETPASTSTGSRSEIQHDKLEEYFASLIQRGRGGSASSTPSKH